MVPAGKSLQASDYAGADINLRLVVEDELVVVHGAVEVFVRNRELLLLLKDGRLFSGEGRSQHFLQLRDWERLLEVANDIEPEGLGQFLGGLDDPYIDTAHENDAGLAVALAEQAEDLDAIHLGHDEIKEDNAGFRANVVKELFWCPGNRTL